MLGPSVLTLFWLDNVWLVIDVAGGWIHRVDLKDGEWSVYAGCEHGGCRGIEEACTEQEGSN